MKNLSHVAFEARNLTKKFVYKVNSAGAWGWAKDLLRSEQKESLAVDQLSFRVSQGARVAFVGPNGAGKSTTIKMLTGVLQPSSGEVSVLGLTPGKDRKELSYKVGTVFGQRSQLWYHLPAQESLDLLARIYDQPWRTYQVRRQELAKRFQIQDLLLRPVRELSLGERMRCEIAASLLHRPQVLFLDEPTIGLDALGKSIIRDLINETSENEGTTVLLTSHDTADMEQVCGRAIVINHGKIIWDETIQKLRQKFIQKKMVTLVTPQERMKFELEGVKTVSSEGHRTILEIDTGAVRLDRVLQKVLAETELRDVCVEDPPMDEIIKQIYQSGGSIQSRESGAEK